MTPCSTCNNAPHCPDTSGSSASCPEYSRGDDVEPKYIDFEITYQGSVVVNSAWIEYQNAYVTLVCIDLQTKYAKMWGSGSGLVMIGSGDHTIKKHPTAEGSTNIKFPSLKGWDVFSHSVGRYTACITFQKQRS